MIKLLMYWAALAISAALDMVLLSVAHGIDARVPAFGYLVTLLLTVVFMGPLLVYDVKKALDNE